MMEYSGIISWLITLTYLSRSGCHVLDHIDNGSVCPPRTKYNMELLSSLVGVEKAIRDAVHSVTEQIITCPDDCDHTAGKHYENTPM